MSVSFARAVADGMRAHGITVHFWPGWEWRGNGQTSAYAGGIVHHTASGYGDAYPLLVDGRSNLSGPLCNSSGNDDGSITIIAAHPANHAGAAGGSWARPFPDTRNFNRMVWGHEIVYPGNQPMRPAQYHTAQILGGVISGILARPNPEWIRAHYETSTTGKWDPGYAPGRSIDMHAFRAGIWDALHSTGDDDMKDDERRALFQILGELLGPRGENGQISGWGTTNGPRTVVAMLVDLVNAAYAPIPSAVTGSDYEAPPRQYLANVDGYGWSNTQKLFGLLAAFDELADAWAQGRDTDAATIKTAVREALEEGVVNVDVHVEGSNPPDLAVADKRAQLDQEASNGSA